MNIGIDLISFYTPPFFLPLKDLAIQRKVDAEKFTLGIGQEKMSIVPPDEDVVTMATNAAFEIVNQVDKNSIKAVIFATETGVDQSKSAGLFVHSLLGLSEECRVIEVKQACYSSTYALQSAIAMIHQKPDDKILVISSDVAKYALHSPGEATQGCAAVAMLISQNPRILTVDSDSAYICKDVMDFWRPNYSDSAFVDGKYSTKIYLKALKVCWQKYVQMTKLLPNQVHHFCFHLPFSRMAEKALKQIFQSTEEFSSHLKKASPGLIYNRLVGNSYTASLYLNLCSLFDNCEENLSSKRIGLFSYGSGFVAEFFSGLVQKNYHQHIMKDIHSRIVSQRQKLDYEQYLQFYNFSLPTTGEHFVIPKFTSGRFRFSGLEDHKRLYEAT